MPFDPRWIPLLYRLHTWYYRVIEQGWLYPGQEVLLDHRFEFHATAHVETQLRATADLAQMYERFCQDMYKDFQWPDMDAPFLVDFYNFLLCLGHALKLSVVDQYQRINSVDIVNPPQRYMTMEVAQQITGTFAELKLPQRTQMLEDACLAMNE